VIEPRREGLKARARDIWRYRRLLLFFVTKSFQKLYAKTQLGWSWVLIRPLFPLIVSTLVFGGVLGVGSQGVPYFLFVAVGNSVWDLFAQAATWDTRSLDMNRQFLSRIYIPRLILPIANMAPALLNFAIHLGIILVAVGYYRFTTGVFYLAPWNLPWALVGVALAMLLALGISLWTSVPALVARDVRFTLNYVLGFWVLATPVLYPMPPESKYAWVASVNPMTAAVNTFKYGMLGLDVLSMRELATSLAFTVFLLASGLWFFTRHEASAADNA
jgi:lipopolysaccharide transport system permease protein